MRVEGWGLRVEGRGLGIESEVIRVSGSRCRVHGSPNVSVLCLGGSGFRDQILGRRVSGSGFGVYG